MKQEKHFKTLQSLDPALSTHQVKMSKSNSADAFKIHSNMMHMSGIWPEKTPSYFYKLKTALSWIFPSLLGYAMLLEIMASHGDVIRLSETIYIMTSVVIHLVKLAVYTYKHKTFAKLLEYLKNSIFLSYPVHLDHYMAKTIRLSTFIANAYRHLCLSGMIMFAVYPIVDNKPLPFNFPYDLGKYRFPFYVFQLIGIGFVAWNNSCLDSLTAALMGIAAAQLDILAEKIMLLDENGVNKNEMILRQLKQCVDHHLAIMKYIDLIEEVFTAIILFQFFASILVICNTLFRIVVIPEFSSETFMFVNYFAIMMFEIIMYCWYGNKIIWKSTRIGDACYTFDWYNYNYEVGVYLFIIMERSKRPLAITAMKFSRLSLTSFTSIIQWTYSYLALLLKLYYKQSTKS